MKDVSLHTLFYVSMRYFFLLFVFMFSLSSFSLSDEEKKYWLSRYLSVCHPVKDMKIVSEYGYRKDPITGKKAFHGGIDIHAKYTDVYAMFQGIVLTVGSDGRSGNYIKVIHGSYTVSYCHLSRRYVSEGDTIYAGQPIAVSGNSGRSTGAHLHLTVRKGDDTINPMILLEFINKVRHDALASLGVMEKEVTLLSHDDFLKSFAPLAMQHQKDYGIPSSVTLSQMIHESQWGRSSLAVNGKNFFGIKCSSQWLSEGKPFTIHDDDHKGEKFCSYNTVYESMEHHARLLSSDRYKSCRKYAQTDYHGWLTAIKRAGYATDPEYVKRCESYIRQYKLYLYDQIAMKI